MRVHGRSALMKKMPYVHCEEKVEEVKGINYTPLKQSHPCIESALHEVLGDGRLLPSGGT